MPREFIMAMCESCLGTVYENYPGEPDEKMATTFLMSMGMDIEDHNCDRVETNGDTKCDCPAHGSSSAISI